MFAEPRKITVVTVVEKGKDGAPDNTYHLAYDESIDSFEEMLSATLKNKYLLDLKELLGKKIFADQALVMAGVNPKDHPLGSVRWANMTFDEWEIMLRVHLNVLISVNGDVSMYGLEDVDDAMYDMDAGTPAQAADQWTTIKDRLLDLCPGSRIGTDGDYEKVMRVLDDLERALCLHNVPTTTTAEMRQPLLLPYQGAPAVRKYRRS